MYVWRIRAQGSSLVAATKKRSTRISRKECHVIGADGERQRGHSAHGYCVKLIRVYTRYIIITWKLQHAPKTLSNRCNVFLFFHEKKKFLWEIP